MRHRQGLVLALSATVLLLAGAAPPAGGVSVTVTGLRSAKGQILACLTARPETFPNCDKDPQARKLTVPASGTPHLDFGAVPRGEYAIALIHDENGNGKLDKRLIVPREGFGFSRDAPVRMGPPEFGSAAFAVNGAAVQMAIRMRYMF